MLTRASITPRPWLPTTTCIIGRLVSASPFVPAILFTTDAGTTVSTLTQAVTGVNITAGKTSLKPGDTTKLTVELVGTVTANDEGIEVAPDAVTWSVSGETAATDGEPLDLKQRHPR